MHTFTILLIVLAVINLVGFFWMTIVAFKRSMAWGVIVLLFSPISAVVFALTNWFSASRAFLIYIISFFLFIGSIVYLWAQVGVGNMQQIAQRVQHGELQPARAYSLMLKALTTNGRAEISESNEQGKLPAARASGPGSRQDAKTGDAGEKPAQDAKAPLPADAQAPVPATLEEVSEPQPRDLKPADNKAGTKDLQKTELASKQADQQSADSPNKAGQTQQAPVPDLKHVERDPLAQKKQKEEPKTTIVSMASVSRYIGHYFIITLKNGNQRRGLLRKVESSRLILDRKLYGGNLQYRLRKSEIKTLQMLKHPPEER